MAKKAEPNMASAPPTKTPAGAPSNMPKKTGTHPIGNLGAFAHPPKKKGRK